MNATEQAQVIWRELHRRISVSAPRLLAKVPPGVDAGTLDKVEAQFGFPLPPLLRELYRLHDGIGMPTFEQHGEHKISVPCYFMPVAGMMEDWAFMKELFDAGHLRGRVDEVRGPVRAAWWNPRWLPIASDGAGNFHCVDTDPAPGGVVGQVIAYWHDDGTRTVVARDCGAFLLDHIDVDEWAAQEAEAAKLS